jgi:hypothetical protein
MARPPEARDLAAIASSPASAAMGAVGLQIRAMTVAGRSRGALTPSLATRRADRAPRRAGAVVHHAVAVVVPAVADIRATRRAQAELASIAVRPALPLGPGRARGRTGARGRAVTLPSAQAGGAVGVERAATSEAGLPGIEAAHAKGRRTGRRRVRPVAHGTRLPRIRHAPDGHAHEQAGRHPEARTSPEATGAYAQDDHVRARMQEMGIAYPSRRRTLSLKEREPPAPPPR